MGQASNGRSHRSALQMRCDRHEIVDRERLGSGAGVYFEGLEVTLFYCAFEVVAQRLAALGERLRDHISKGCAICDSRSGQLS